MKRQAEPDQPAIRHCQLADGMQVTIRTILPQDVELVKSFVQELSEKSKYFRFMNSVHALTEAMLARFTQIDHSKEMALIALTLLEGVEVMLGVARFSINQDSSSCEFALVVADRFTGEGLGHKLMLSLMDAARRKGLKTIEGEVLSDNHDMLSLMQHLGFGSKIFAGDRHSVKVSKSL